MRDKDKIFIYTNDYGFRVWINQSFIGCKIDDVVAEALFFKPYQDEVEHYEMLKFYEWDFDFIKIPGLDLSDDEDYDKFEEITSKICNWFSNVKEISDEQWNLIFEQDWLRLFNTL